MSVRAIGVFVAIFLNSICTAPAQELEKKLQNLLNQAVPAEVGKAPLAILTSFSLPGGDASALGRGFSGLGNDWRGDCLEFDPSGGRPPVESVSTHFDLTLIDKAERFMSMMNMSASASMSYGVSSGDASASYLRRIVENSFSNFIAGRVAVYTIPANISAKGLNKLGKDALAAGSDRFHRTCGDRFATSVVYGGEFTFVLEIKSRDDAQYEEIKADVNASLSGFGGGGASFSQTIEKISKKYNLTAAIIRNGLNDPIPELSPAAIQSYAIDFPRKVTENNGIGMQPIRYGVRDYASVDVRSPVFFEPNLGVSRIAYAYMDARRVSGEINYWMNNADEFFFTTSRGLLEQNLKSAEQASDVLIEAALRCADRPSQGCKVPSAIPRYDGRQVPQRLIWVKLPVTDGRRVPLGVVPDGQERRVRFRGLWSPSGGTTWWETPHGNWRIYVIKPDGNQRDGSVGYGGDRIEVSLGDNPYNDNVEHPTDPASAALY